MMKEQNCSNLSLVTVIKIFWNYRDRIICKKA
jgi:hypothetical protein